MRSHPSPSPRGSLVRGPTPLVAALLLPTLLALAPPTGPRAPATSPVREPEADARSALDAPAETALDAPAETTLDAPATPDAEAAPALAAAPDTTPAPAFEDYDVIQYITSDGRGPENVLRLDDNGAIVLAAREGTTRAGLREAGVAFTESGLALLETFRLLEAEGDTLRTAFPILPPERTRALRERVRGVAPETAEGVAPEAERLVATLEASGRPANAYAVLFSHVVDGLVWDAWEERGVIPGREITAETPHWAGEVWALHPPRAFNAGTNTISQGGVALVVSWTEAAIPLMAPFVADFPTLARLFDDYRTVGWVEDARAREVFGPFDLFDEDGRLTVPVLVRGGDDPLSRSARTIADRLAREAPELLDLPALVSEFGFRDEAQALVVAYHELMWEVMDTLEARGIVERPRAFADPDSAGPADVAALVFVVREAR